MSVTDLEPTLDAHTHTDEEDRHPLDGRLEDIEREAIRRALAATGGHRRQAAERLGIGLRTLYEKIKSYGLH